MRTRGKALLALMASAAWLGAPVAGQNDKSSAPIDIQVNAADLLAQPVGANWTSYNGDYSGQRFSSLDQINAGNVA